MNKAALQVDLAAGNVLIFGRNSVCELAHNSQPYAQTFTDICWLNFVDALGNSAVQQSKDAMNI